jgi:hypothetical protein
MIPFHILYFRDSTMRSTLLALLSLPHHICLQTATNVNNNNNNNITATTVVVQRESGSRVVELTMRVGFVDERICVRRRVTQRLIVGTQCFVVLRHFIAKNNRIVSGFAI